MKLPTFPKALSRVMPDMLALLGIGLLIYGVHLIYGPAAWITAGLFILGAAGMLAWLERHQKPEDNT